MGFFDIFKKKDNNENSKKTLPYSIKRNDEGNIQIDYYEHKSKHDDFYDSTRLIIDKMAGDLAYCRVSWYKQDDCVLIVEEKEISRATHYTNVMANIDMNLLQKDPEYVCALICDLLNENRVERYLENGLEENPQNPCGEYMGYIKLENNKYKKYFDPEIGRQSHYSQKMQMKRQARKEREIRSLRDKIKVENANEEVARAKAQEYQKKLDEFEKYK